MRHPFSRRKLPHAAFLISGRGSNMMAILRKVKEKKLPIEPVLVISDNPEAEGLARARKEGVETMVIERKNFKSDIEHEREILTELQRVQAEWVICAGYMRLLHEPVLKAYPRRILNVHPSLLPAFKGLKAQRQALEYGVKYSGCTIHLVDAGIDTGPIVRQAVVEIDDNETEESLARKIMKEEHEQYWRAIKEVVNGFTVEGRRVVPRKRVRR